MTIQTTIVKITPYRAYAGYFNVHTESGRVRFESVAVFKRTEILEEFNMSDEDFERLLKS